MNEEEKEAVGFVSPSQYLKTMKLADLTAMGVISCGMAGRKMPSKKFRRVLQGAIHQILLYCIADPQITFSGVDEPDHSLVELVQQEKGSRIPVYSHSICISPSFKDESGNYDLGDV